MPMGQLRFGLQKTCQNAFFEAQKIDFGQAFSRIESVRCPCANRKPVTRKYMPNRLFAGRKIDFGRSLQELRP